MNSFNKLKALSKEIALLSSIHSLLEWDQETMMPSLGIDLKASQLELMATLIHRKKTSRQWATLLKGTSQDPRERAALKQWQRDYLKATKLSSSFVKKMAKTTSESIHVWAKAKEARDFNLFKPHLTKLVDLARKKCEALGESEHPYDALLDLYEPEMTVSILSPLFDRLKSKLVRLIQNPRKFPQDFLFGTFAAEQQTKFHHQLLDAFGCTKECCRLDLSSHPFCSGFHPHDTRMTTRIHPRSLMSSIFAVIHEAGHGMYNMGLPVEHFGTPLAESVSLGIDESQSRWWETLVGHSLPFWGYFYPKLQLLFPEKLSHITLEAFYRAINHTELSLIRLEADEVTYSLHIIVRFELEKALIEGSLQVKDLPDAWGEKMQKYFGLTPQHDGEGCLQDIHWSMGGFGYFPTYTLGNLYAAQFFAVFAKAHPDWEKRVASGEFLFMREWLRVNIHQFGREFSPQELVLRITKKPLHEDDFVNYLEHKYRQL